MGVHRDFTGSRDFLQTLSLFHTLDARQLELVDAATTELRASAGAAVYRRGDPCDGMHVIVTGRVKLALPAREGAEKVVEILGPGQSFGEAVMFIDGPYNLHVEALTDSLLLHIEKQAILEAVEASPAFARRMLNELALRQCRLVADIEGYTLKNATNRVTGYLLAALEDQHPVPGQPAGVLLAASKSVLASRLNITREHFSRILHELSQAGLIRVSGRNIHILDRTGLRQHSA